ncbi:hypothetical protein HOE31_01145 [bacterium]|nr:hypothetical protein [bacterium]
MNILIRAYGSHLMGMGHLYRIKKLVTKLKEKQNCTITLFTQKYDEAASIYKDIQVDKVIEIVPNISINDEIKELENIFKNKYDICINDQLNTDTKIAILLTTKCINSITFDDLGDGNYLFNHCINVLYPSNKKRDNEINSYSYMLLDNYLSIKENLTYKKEIKTIFINQGAADTWGAIPDMIKDLNLIQNDFKIKVLLGPSFKHFDELDDALKTNKKQIEIINNTDSVVELAKDCELAILGAGNTLFEIASLGIPVIASTREQKELITITRLLKDNIIYANNKLYRSNLNILVEEIYNNDIDRKLKYEQNRNVCNYNGLDKIIKLINGE